MAYLTTEELKELEKCKTVSGMLEYCLKNFNLNIVPPIMTKSILLTGLKTALNLLKPDRIK